MASLSVEMQLCLFVSLLNSHARDLGNHTEHTAVAQGEEKEAATKPKIKSEYLIKRHLF